MPKSIDKRIDGPGSSRGYRSVWHSLQIQGLRVSHTLVQHLVHEVDPHGCNMRCSRRLRWRVYRNASPNYSWHCDGYDKMTPYGFPIHGCIDGYSRNILWLYVTKSNTFPSTITAFYLHAVSEFNGCPVNLITDAGTENGTMAGLHSFFRNDLNSHRYVTSPQNQRIEGWWSCFCRTSANWWINQFKDLCDSGTVDLTVQVEKELLWFCYAELLQRYLNDVQFHWNSYYIRHSRHKTTPGRPDSLHYLPESQTAVPGLIKEVPDYEIKYAKEHLTEYSWKNDYEEYFRYIMNQQGFQTPVTTNDALQLFTLMKGYVNEQSSI